MLDIELELENIIEKYDLDRHYPAYRISMTARRYIKEMIEQFIAVGGGKSCVFITSRWEVQEWIGRWARGNTEVVSAIRISDVDSLYEYTVKLEKADHIYVASYEQTNVILHWLWEHDIEAQSLYDVLEEQHIYVQMEFVDFFLPLTFDKELGLDDDMWKDGNRSSLVLYEYYYQKQRLRHDGKTRHHKRILEKLFFLAIVMRNFVEAERLLAKMPEGHEYCACWQELEALLFRIREELHRKKQKDIIIYWLDAFRYTDAEKLGYLKERREHSVFYTNAYTSTTNTRPTMNLMFRGIWQMDDAGYKEKYVGLSNSPLLADIAAAGYDFRIISSYLERYFDAGYAAGRRTLTEYISPCSEVFWDMADQMLRQEKPTVYLAHSLTEMHNPCLSVQRERFEQVQEYPAEVTAMQIKEVDEQLRFYDTLVGEAAYRIYMSDHGSKSNVCNNFHVLFQVYHISWRKKIRESVFCYADFPKILSALLCGQDIDQAMDNRQSVPLQDVDWYNPGHVGLIVEQEGLDTILFKTRFKGLATRDHLYLRFKTGRELLHRWADGDYIPTAGEALAVTKPEIPADLREKTGAFPAFLDTDVRFSVSKNIYLVYENLKSTVAKAASVLNEIMRGYGEGSVYLYAGGYHTRQLLSIMTQESMGKIGGIIDQDPKCLCAGLGFSIRHPDHILPAEEKILLLSSRRYLRELQTEARDRYPQMTVLDIYKMWRENGLDFPREFWYGVEEDRPKLNRQDTETGKRDRSLFDEIRTVAGLQKTDIVPADSVLYSHLRREAEQFRHEAELHKYMDMVYGNVKAMIPKLAKSINELLEGYDNESIVLRPGGFHTMQLCALFDANSRKKIAGIVDGHKQCECRNLGYRIYGSDETLPANIKTVLLSTFINLDEMKADADERWPDLAKLDVYAAWAAQGYHFWKDFWYGTKDDWRE